MHFISICKIISCLQIMGGARVCKIANFRSNWKLKQCQLQVSVAVRLLTPEVLFLLTFEWFYKISWWFRRIFDIQAKRIIFDAIDKLEKRKNKTGRGKSLKGIIMTDVTTHQAPMAISTPNSWFVSLSSWSWLWPAVSPSCSSVRFISSLRPQSVSCVCVKLLLFARPIDK